MEGFVKSQRSGKVSVITFYHPKSNSLPLRLLELLADSIKKASEEENTNIIVLQSKGEKAFCAGASFDELISIEDFEHGKKFFMGFANVINAMRKSNKFIIARIQGKIVGGGVGLTAAADYAIALSTASVKLSELALSIGPFVIGPAVRRKLGAAAFQNITIDHQWRSAQWALNNNLFSRVVDSIEELDNAVFSLANELSELNPETIKDMKRCFWEGTENWDVLLEKRAELSGKLILSDFTKNYINNFLNTRKKNN